MLNVVTLMGRLVKEPEIRYTNSQKAVISNTLAVERDFKDASGNKITDFIDVVIWGSSAEYISKYASKGSTIAVTGKIQIREWEDKEGKKHRPAEVIASSVYIIDYKKQASDSNVNEADLKEPTAPVFMETDGDLPF